MEEKKMKFETFKEPLGDWADKLRPYIESEEMWSMYQKIKSDAHDFGVVPKSSDTFRAFKSCKLSNLRVVFYLQDPYPRLYKDGTPQATGIAMDCRNTPDGKKIQPSLEYFYDAIDRHMAKVNEHPYGTERTDNPPKCLRSPNLDYLHEQGVIMLNTDLTCRVKETGSHEGLWEGFQKYLLGDVLRSHTGIIYVLCGKTSQSLKKYINPLGNYIFELEHPMAGDHRGDKVWRDEDIFTKINTILKENNGEPYKIWWDKQDWDFYNECPF